MVEETFNSRLHLSSVSSRPSLATAWAPRRLWSTLSKKSTPPLSSLSRPPSRARNARSTRSIPFDEAAVQRLASDEDQGAAPAGCRRTASRQRPSAVLARAQEYAAKFDANHARLEPRLDAAAERLEGRLPEGIAPLKAIDTSMSAQASSGNAISSTGKCWRVKCAASYLAPKQKD